MSWADDIRCLYCDGRLPLYRKITNGQFCSSAHRKAYWQEQERLAVERLHQTHDSLRAYRPAGGAEAILGTDGERPRWLTLANTGQVPMIGFFPDPTPVHARWMKEQLAGAEPAAIESTKIARRPIFIYRARQGAVALAGFIRLALRDHDARIVPSTEIAPAAARIEPVSGVAWNFALDGGAVAQLMEAVREEMPEMAGLLSLARPAFRDCMLALRGDGSPVAVLLELAMPAGDAKAAEIHGLAAFGGAISLAMCGMADSAAIPAGAAQAIDPRGAEVSLGSMSAAQASPRLRLASGSRYAVTMQNGSARAAEPSALPIAAGSIAIPERREKVVPARVSKKPAAEAITEPAPAGLVKVPASIAANSTGAPAMARFSASAFPQPPRVEAMLPAARFEPAMESAGPMPPAGFSVTLPPYEHLEAPESGRAHVWTVAIDFWNRAPRDLKLLAFAIPVLLGLALHPGLPKVRTASPANTTGMQRGFEQAMTAEWSNVRQTVVDRAAVALDEDFRSGLDDWASRWTVRGDTQTQWSFDQTGFVRPGPLALYKPSIGLTDYQLQFLGMIDHQAMSWVVRAADFDNFYVVKLEVLKPGPLPALGVTRYAVVNGKADSRVDTVVNMDARPDTLYRVRMEIHGDEFLLMIQGQVIDSWSEPRLKHGGIGFFAAHGEDSRIRWVQVTHQYDMLGRLCAYLAPYNMTQSGGSLQP